MSRARTTLSLNLKAMERGYLGRKLESQSLAFAAYDEVLVV